MTNDEFTNWRTSSYCDANGCIEVHTADKIYVRDSKLGEGSPQLTFTPEEWQAFILGVKNNEFDLS